MYLAHAAKAQARHRTQHTTSEEAAKTDRKAGNQGSTENKNKERSNDEEQFARAEKMREETRKLELAARDDTNVAKELKSGVMYTCIWGSGKPCLPPDQHPQCVSRGLVWQEFPPSPWGPIQSPINDDHAISEEEETLTEESFDKYLSSLNEIDHPEQSQSDVGLTGHTFDANEFSRGEFAMNEANDMEQFLSTPNESDQTEQFQSATNLTSHTFSMNGVAMSEADEMEQFLSMLNEGDQTEPFQSATNLTSHTFGVNGVAMSEADEMEQFLSMLNEGDQTEQFQSATNPTGHTFGMNGVAMNEADDMEQFLLTLNEMDPTEPFQSAVNEPNDPEKYQSEPLPTPSTTTKKPPLSEQELKLFQKAMNEINGTEQYSLELSPTTSSFPKLQQPTMPTTPHSTQQQPLTPESLVPPSQTSQYVANSMLLPPQLRLPRNGTPGNGMNLQVAGTAPRFGLTFEQALLRSASLSSNHSAANNEGQQLHTPFSTPSPTQRGPSTPKSRTPAPQVSSLAARFTSPPTQAYESPYGPPGTLSPRAIASLRRSKQPSQLASTPTSPLRQASAQKSSPAQQQPSTPTPKSRTKRQSRAMSPGNASSSKKRRCPPADVVAHSASAGPGGPGRTHMYAAVTGGDAFLGGPYNHMSPSMDVQTASMSSAGHSPAAGIPQMYSPATGNNAYLGGPYNHYPPSAYLNYQIPTSIKVPWGPPPTIPQLDPNATPSRSPWDGGPSQYAPTRPPLQAFHTPSSMNSAPSMTARARKPQMEQYHAQSFNGQPAQPMFSPQRGAFQTTQQQYRAAPPAWLIADGSQQMVQPAFSRPMQYGSQQGGPSLNNGRQFGLQQAQLGFQSDHSFDRRLEGDRQHGRGSQQAQVATGGRQNGSYQENGSQLGVEQVQPDDMGYGDLLGEFPWDAGTQWDDSEQFGDDSRLAQLSTGGQQDGGQQDGSQQNGPERLGPQPNDNAHDLQAQEMYNVMMNTQRDDSQQNAPQQQGTGQEISEQSDALQVQIGEMGSDFQSDLPSQPHEMGSDLLEDFGDLEDLSWADEPDMDFTQQADNQQLQHAGLMGNTQSPSLMGIDNQQLYGTQQVQTAAFMGHNNMQNDGGSAQQVNKSQSAQQPVLMSNNIDPSLMAMGSQHQYGAQQQMQPAAFTPEYGAQQNEMMAAHSRLTFLGAAQQQYGGGAQQMMPPPAFMGDNNNNNNYNYHYNMQHGAQPMQPAFMDMGHNMQHGGGVGDVQRALPKPAAARSRKPAAAKQQKPAAAQPQKPTATARPAPKKSRKQAPTPGPPVSASPSQSGFASMYQRPAMGAGASPQAQDLSAQPVWMQEQQRRFLADLKKSREG